MSIPVRSRIAHVLPYAFCLLTSACFDVREVPVEPKAEAGVLLIDDFEDGDQRPSAAAFAPWRCVTNPGLGRQPVQCGPALEGYASEHGYRMWFELTEQANGAPDYPEASLFAPAVEPATGLDVSDYQQVGLHVRVELDSGLPEQASLGVTLGCASTEMNPISISNIAAVAAEWQPVALPLENFVQPEWQTEGVQGVDRADCVRHMSGITFTFGASLREGETRAGTLWVDNVYLQ